MKLAHKGRARHDRRVLNRRRAKEGFFTQNRPAFTIGQEVMLVDDAYGKRYVNRTVKVVGFEDGRIMVQSPYRKNPMAVEERHLKAA